MTRRKPGDSRHEVRRSEKLGLFSDRWSPKIIGELNGQRVKLAKLKGEFIWHHHADEDELFLVLQGSLALHLRDRVVNLTDGELFTVPRGVGDSAALHRKE